APRYQGPQSREPASTARTSGLSSSIAFFRASRSTPRFPMHPTGVTTVTSFTSTPPTTHSASSAQHGNPYDTCVILPICLRVFRLRLPTYNRTGTQEFEHHGRSHDRGHTSHVIGRLDLYKVEAYDVPKVPQITK